MQADATVYFDSGLEGQKSFARYEAMAAPSDVDRNDGNLIATWRNVNNEMVRSFTDEFLNGNTILEVYLTNEEGDEPTL